MLDSTNRPKGSQRRLVRKQLPSPSQSAGSKSQVVRREPGMVKAEMQGPTNGSPASPNLRVRPQRNMGMTPSASNRRSRRNSFNPFALFQKALAKPSQRPKPRSPENVSSTPASRQSSHPNRTPQRRSGNPPPGGQVSQPRRPVRPATGRVRPEVSKPRPEPGKSPSVRSKPTPPLVYLVRLLILGVGVGAIAGTVISVWDPSMRYPAEANRTTPTQVTQSASSGQANGQPGMLASIATVRMGREMTELVGKVTPLTQNLTDLGPGVFVLDLDNGDFFSFNGNTTFSAASMIKVPILVAFFQDVDAGKIKLDDILSIEQADIAEGSGDMQYAGAGSQYSALETATNMIITSDNTATNMIIRRMGGIEVLNRRFQQWGMQQSTLRNLLPDLEGTNTTSPKELVSLLSLINDGKLVSMKSRDRIFDIMRRTQTDTLLPSVLSPGSTIAHKTGDIGSLVGDVGIVDLQAGRRYAIAAMVKRPHNDARAQELIRQIAAVVYEQFGGQPVLLPSPIPPTQAVPQQPMVPGMSTPMAPGMPTPTVSPAMTLPQTMPTPMAPSPVAPLPEAVPSPESATPEPAPDATDSTSPEAETEAEAEVPTDQTTEQTL